jgi:hypothetical protein
MSARRQSECLLTLKEGADMTKKQTKTTKAGSSRKAPKTAPARAPKAAPARERDPRLPAAGTTIVRAYKGKDYRVKVLADGFELDGKPFRSLTALARAVTGYAAISGPAWIGLGEPKEPTPKTAKAKPKPAVVREPAPETAPAPETPAA